MPSEHRLRYLTAVLALSCVALLITRATKRTQPIRENAGARRQETPAGISPSATLSSAPALGIPYTAQGHVSTFPTTLAAETTAVSAGAVTSADAASEAPEKGRQGSLSKATNRSQPSANRVVTQLLRYAMGPWRGAFDPDVFLDVANAVYTNAETIVFPCSDYFHWSRLGGHIGGLGTAPLVRPPCFANDATAVQTIKIYYSVAIGRLAYDASIQRMYEAVVDNTRVGKDTSELELHRLHTFHRTIAKLIAGIVESAAMSNTWGSRSRSYSCA